MIQISKTDNVIEFIRQIVFSSPRISKMIRLNLAKPTF